MMSLSLFPNLSWRRIRRRISYPMLKISMLLGIRKQLKIDILYSQKLTCDILTISLSTVASESTFSLCGRVLDAFRSSPKPDMFEASMGALEIGYLAKMMISVLPCF